MAFNFFASGLKITMEDMLEAREKRAMLQSEILHEYPENALICFTLNIPGPVKNIPIIEQVFEIIYEELKRSVVKGQSCLTKSYNRKTGLELFISLPGDPNEIKKKMIEIENTHIFGRIADLDVLYATENQIVVTSRKNYGIAPRKCYLCGNDAKICGRSKKHSIDEIQEAISRIASTLIK
ncbi:citrate lyase holo-[acyl-carrier protein] synthase [Enterococcus montenegrensis]|uniref:citrate lyase holo-[acyl-carrier protein] synthase n=1 Tax=Enterococcus montenegrensis TaxID=3031993 RepID=UPI00249ECF03|nr:citrate lyase holo-[acyl-carrier protein] synthase [Enterococcus montenegrensis]WHA09872.1 citrate lyase holo-[acyl-carrier protein] synthase [Enterococcus montenegrensis]